MNTKTTITALAILSMVVLVTAMAASSILNTAFAAQTEGKKGGPNAQNNYGDCKDDFNDNVCKKKFTGSG